MRILLAEDNDTNRRVARKLVVSLGHTVDSVENGFEAVEKVRSGDYDIVIMDVQMPIVDGREATRRIRQEFKDTGGGPQVIAVTANGMIAEREACLEAGMNDYLEKPIRLDVLKRAIDGACEAITNSDSMVSPSKLDVDTSDKRS